MIAAPAPRPARSVPVAPGPTPRPPLRARPWSSSRRAWARSRSRWTATRPRLTVDNFLQYARSGHYDGTIFHRSSRNFMIQGGGFDGGHEPEDHHGRPSGTRPVNGLKNRRGHGRHGPAPTIPTAPRRSSSSTSRTTPPWTTACATRVCGVRRGGGRVWTWWTASRRAHDHPPTPTRTCLRCRWVIKSAREEGGASLPPRRAKPRSSPKPRPAPGRAPPPAVAAPSPTSVRAPRCAGAGRSRASWSSARPRTGRRTGWRPLRRGARANPVPTRRRRGRKGRALFQRTARSATGRKARATGPRREREGPHDPTVQQRLTDGSLLEDRHGPEEGGRDGDAGLRPPDRRRGPLEDRPLRATLEAAPPPP
jgi:hypothetical protein